MKITISAVFMLHWSYVLLTRLLHWMNYIH